MAISRASCQKETIPMAEQLSSSSVQRANKDSFTVDIDQVSESEWSLLLDQFADATVYQTWAYGAVSWGEQQISHLVLRQDGAVVATAQLRIVQLPVLRKGIAYLRWGPLWRRRGRPADIRVLREVALAIKDEYVNRRGLLLRVVPNTFREDRFAIAVVEAWHLQGSIIVDSSAAYRTIRVDLTSPIEALRKNLDQKWRNQLNAAERNGLAVAEGTTDDLYEQFLGLYSDMMARKQFDTTVDVREFRRIQQRLPHQQKMLILICHKDGRPMTGLIGSALGDTGIYLLGATSTEGMKTKGSYLLQWLMMQRLRERGCQAYDLGGVNPDQNPGVYHFKQGFGGQEVHQLHRLEMSRNSLSGLCVRLGESARNTLGVLRSRLRAVPKRETTPVVST